MPAALTRGVMALMLSAGCAGVDREIFFLVPPGGG